MAHALRSIESAIRILMGEGPAHDGAVTLWLVGCCAGTCATICCCWAGKGLVSTVSGGFYFVQHISGRLLSVDNL